MYIPIRTHFKHLLEMGLGYIHIQRGVCCSSYFDGLMPDASGSGTSNDKAPAFLFYKPSPFWACGDIGSVVRERIVQFLKYNPRNKVVFIPSIVSCLKTIDVGYELANYIKDYLNSPHLAMIAEDGFNSLMSHAIMYDEMIGNYVAITNWGILFEPILKFNLLTLFDSLSKNKTLILIDCGQADYEKFYLVSKHFNTTFSIGNLHPYIIQ